MAFLRRENKNLFQSLFSSNRLYNEEIETLQAKSDSSLYAHELDATSLFGTISLKRGKFVGLLRKSLRDGTYTPGYAQLVSIKRKDKMRSVYQFPVVDRIVHGVLAKILIEEMGPSLSPHLYSYRKDQNWSTAVKNFTDYIRSHRKLVKETRERGLYVLRADVRRYTESIPVDSNSLLWEQLSRLTESAGSLQPKVLELLCQAVRPEVLSAEGGRYVPLTGVPFGSPLSTVIFNLYLKDLDEALQALDSEAFYARYGDDILYAHPSLDVVKAFERMLTEQLSHRRLELSRKKHSLLYFNGAGRKSDQSLAIRGAHSITFLGVRVNFDGTVGLKKGIVRNTLKEVRRRARNHHQMYRTESLKDRTRILCALLNQIFDGNLAHSTYSADMLLRCISDRTLLKYLDLEIANIVAETVSEKSGKGAFDTVSYRALRNEYGLKSLTAARNSYGEVRA